MIRQWFKFVPVIIHNGPKRFEEAKPIFPVGTRHGNCVTRGYDSNPWNEQSDRTVLSYVEATTQQACDYLLSLQSSYLNIHKLTEEQADALARQMQPERQIQDPITGNARTIAALDIRSI